jgi:hypothetical protein
MEPRICWLASYPKSGNTWVRFLLHQYFFGEVSGSEEIQQTVPDFHVVGMDLTGREVEGKILVKAHLRPSERMPLFDRTESAIYIVRHPRDVIRSSLDYTRLTMPDVMERVFDPREYVHRFLRIGGDPLFQRFGFGTLLEHVDAWSARLPFERLFVRYEDLKSRPGVELARMLHFLGHEPDFDRVKESVEASSFERMRSLEIREKASGKATAIFAGTPDRAKAGRVFMSAGVVGRSLDDIEPGLDELVEQRFAPVIGRFGYASVNAGLEQGAA